MKKIVVSFIFILTFMLVLFGTALVTNADETEEAPVANEEQVANEEETPVVDSDPVVDNDPVVEDEPTDSADTDAELTEEDFKNEVSAYLEQYLEKSLVEKIIGWFTDIGALAALFGVYLKYRKYKSTTIEDLVGMVKSEVGKYLTENFDKLSVDQIDKIKTAIKSLENSNETIMKVLVLMQDNTAKGKAALIDYLGSKTNNEEVKEAADEVKETLEKLEAEKQEVLNKVSGEYKDLF